MIELVVPYEGSMVTVKKKGRCYRIADSTVELFRPCVMALAVGRKPPTIQRWEEDGKFPPPVFKVLSGNTKTRWYSSVQIMNCHKVWHRYGCRKRLDKESPELFEKFLAELRDVFYEKELVDV